MKKFVSFLLVVSSAVGVLAAVPTAIWLLSMAIYAVEGGSMGRITLLPRWVIAASPLALLSASSPVCRFWETVADAVYRLDRPRDDPYRKKPINFL